MADEKIISYRSKLATAEFRTWKAMKTRCYNKNCQKYPRYGGRGITICQRWLESFENFLSDMGQKPSKAHTIERIDNDGNYCPENCRWATPKEQARNTRRNVIVLVDGIEMTVSQWAERSGRPASTVYGRIRRGYPKDQAAI